MNEELKKIKKHYGEEMMHLCRELFPTILEEEGVLLSLLEATFPHSKYLCDDIIKDNQVESFKDFIYDKYFNKEEDKSEKIIVSPFELMDMAGYILYECHSEDDIQKFKKYYAEDEELCTFAGGRLSVSRVFFAVKKNVDEIKRENFPNPERQDEYGTSVISIQYRRGERNTLSIKNRYNHTVDNPDATFGNNLDNIIEGLNDSFELTYNLSHTGSCDKFELRNYVRGKDGRYYKYAYEIDEVYYGPDNLIIDNYEVVKEYQEKEKYLIIDYFVIDLVNKRIFAYNHNDKYIEGLNNIAKIEISRIANSKRKRIVLIMNNGQEVIFEVDKFNRITKIVDNYTTVIPDSSLQKIMYLKELSMSKVIRCGSSFLLENGTLMTIEMPKVTYIGDNFLRTNMSLKELDFPELLEVGNCFVRINDTMRKFNFPNLITVGDYFMDLNRMLEVVKLPNVKMIGSWFLSSNNRITSLEMPKLEKVASNFLSTNKQIRCIDFPKLLEVGGCFFRESMAKDVKLPKLVKIGSYFMDKNYQISEISLPQVISVGNDFIAENRVIEYISMPNLVIVGDNFLKNNDLLKEISFPKLEMCGNDFISYNMDASFVNLPMLQCTGSCFLRYSYKIKESLYDVMEEVEIENQKRLVRKR